MPDSQIVDDEVRMWLAVAVAEQDQPHVEGRIFFDNRLPAEDLVLRLYHHGFADAQTLLVEGKTDANGFYSLVYDKGSIGRKSFS